MLWGVPAAAAWETAAGVRAWAAAATVWAMGGGAPAAAAEAAAAAAQTCRPGGLPEHEPR